MRVALLQGPEAPGPKAAMLATLRRAATQAASEGAQLLVLPELFLTGYNIGADALHASAEPADGPSAAQAAAIARQSGVALLYGYPECGAQGRLHNSALLLGPAGETLANYRKTHLFGDMERQVFSPGEDAFVLADVAGRRVGLLICYDVEFPELVRGLALRGADLVAVPTALMTPYHFVPRMMLPVRAFENQLFLVYANRCGREAGLAYVGESRIVAPDGSVLACAGAGEALLTATLDDAAMRRSRALNTYLQDRQPTRYREPDAHP